jgi:hypothetical protein
MVHAAGGILVLLVITTLSVFKPWGKTSYGLRREPIEGVSLMSLSPTALPDPDNGGTADGLPVGRKRFVTVMGVIVVGFVLLHLVVLHLIVGGLGSHGH